jgi:hypothetical protein
MVFSTALVSDISAKTIAVIIKVKGNVTLYKDNKVSEQKLRRGTRLIAGDKLVTDSKGYAAIRFTDDKSLLRVRSNSTCTIRTREEKNETIKNVFLEVGTIYARVTKQNAKFEVQTPTSVASVKGTEWITKQILKGATYYYGRSGVFEVSNEIGSVLCREDETVEVLDSNSMPITRKTIEGEVDWDFDSEQEDYEFRFENEQGQKRILRFRVQVEE